MKKGQIDGMDLTIMRDCIRKRTHHDGTFQPPYDGYVIREFHSKAHTLVRHGFMARTQFSEQIRGERRFCWWSFSVTDKGRKALADVIDEGVRLL